MAPNKIDKARKLYASQGHTVAEIAQRLGGECGNGLLASGGRRWIGDPIASGHIG